MKNTFSVNRKRDLTTKAREAILAIELEKQLTKSQILEDYLNLVYFGNGAYGVQAAVERYFPCTPLAKLDLAQAALLAGLIQSPEALNPIKHPGAAARRRSEVLDAMVANGKITGDAAARSRSRCRCRRTVSYPHAGAARLLHGRGQERPAQRRPERRRAIPAEVLGSTQQARANAVYRGGLKIYTSYDPTLQFEATAAVNDGAAEVAVHRVARRHRQRRRRRARDRERPHVRARCSSTPRPRVPAARPVRRSRCSRSRPR